MEKCDGCNGRKNGRWYCEGCHDELLNEAVAERKERGEPLTVNEVIPTCTDPEIKEVLQAFLMLKQFDAGYRFAQQRAARLSQEAIDKCAEYMQKKLEEYENT